MSYQWYELLSLGARYWFVLLGVLIVLRSFWWLHRDRQQKHRRLRQLPDAGLIGELLVLQGSQACPEGTLLPLPREGVLGSRRVCDVSVPVSGVAPQHLDFMFEEGEGLRLCPLFGCICVADGETLTRRYWRDQEPLRHGSVLKVGEALLQVRLFAGIETGGHARMEEDPAQTQGYTFRTVPDEWLQPSAPDDGWTDGREAPQDEWRDGQ